MFLEPDSKKKHVASFSWGENESYALAKAWEVNKNIASMIDEELSDHDYLILKDVHSNYLRFNL